MFKLEVGMGHHGNSGGRPPDVKKKETWVVFAMIGMISLPAAITLHTVQISALIDVANRNPSPHGYTVSLLLFIVPISVIGIWFLPQDHVRISKTAFWLTILILFPVGALLDFFFARYFLRFPDPMATLRIPAPALGGSVPVEEYIFYFTGFLAVLLLYIWLDEYWLAAYNIPADSAERSTFVRLLRFHPESLAAAILLIAFALYYKKFLSDERDGFPGYFIFLTLTALLPSAALFPAARSFINWRAFSLTAFNILLTSLLWEATLAIPYGWWNYQPREMVGINVLAWGHLPFEAVLVWLSVTYATVIVYEVVKRWQASGKKAKLAFFGSDAG